MAELEVKGIEQAEALLTGMPGAAQKAIKTAVKNAARGVKREAAQKARERYTIKPSRITRTLKVYGTADGAELVSRGRVNDLADFIHRPRSVPKRRPAAGNYLYSQVLVDGGGTIAHAFLAKMKNGHVGVMRRTEGNKSYPIVKIAGPSTPQMLESPTVKGFIERRLKERASKNLDHEVNAFLQGYRR